MERMDRITRRRFLRGTIMGGSGLLAVYVVGCGDEEEPGEEQTAAPTTAAARTIAATATPAPTTPVMRWRRLEPAGALPAGRRDHSVVTDGRSLLLFGGRNDAGALGDLWAYDLQAGTWAELRGAPPPRFGHNAVLEEIGRSVLVFGGQDGGSFFNDVWTFDTALGAWSQRSPRGDGPPSRYGAASALESPGRMVISHGFTNTGRFDDTWSLAVGIEGEAWTDSSPSATRPVKRCLCRGAWDSRRSRFLMFGGQTDGQPFLGDLWALDANGWTEITSEPKPSPRNFYAMATLDTALVALFGGNSQDGPGPVNDLWFLDTASDTWTQMEVEGEAPSPRYGHDAVWLANSRKLIVFGGHDASGDVNDLWELTVPA